MTRVSRHVLAVAAVVLLGAALRLAVNNVTVFSQADETVYLHYARALSADWSSYGRIVNEYIDHPASWVYPVPSRWAGVLVTSAACWIAGCDFRTLAAVETVAGIAAIAVTYLLGATLFGRLCGWLAAAFVAVATIQLGMGRRALEDELFLLAVLGAIGATVAIARAERVSAKLLVGGIAAYAICLGVKEVFLLYYPALAALLLIIRGAWRPRLGDLALFALSPVAYAAMFALLTTDPAALLSIAQIYHTERTADVLYVLQYQSGPPFEPLLDIYVLAPVVTVVGLIALGRATSDVPGRRHALALGAFLALLLFSYAVVLKDARYYMPADETLRLLAAWCVVSLASVRPAIAPLVVGLVATVNAVVELVIFAAVFLGANVYDPVLANLLRALDAIPR